MEETARRSARDRRARRRGAGILALVAIVNVAAIAAPTTAAHAAAGVVEAWVAGGGSSNDTGTSIVTDTAGNIYVGGCFEPGATFGSGPLMASPTSGPDGADDGFVASYDASGAIRWFQQIDNTSSNGCVNDLAIGPSGEIYVVGDFPTTATFDNGTVTLNAVGTSGTGYLARYESSGTFTWAQVAGLDAESVSADANGPVIGGRFLGSPTFGTGPNAVTLTNTGPADGFVVALDPAGAGRWGRQFGVALGLLNVTDVYGVTHDASGNVIAVGGFDTSTNLGTGTVNAVGGRDIFIVKYNASGVRQWAQTTGGPNTDRAGSVVTDAVGNIYVAGEASAGAVFGSGAGATTVTGAGSIDAFVAKYGPSGGFWWVRTAGGPENDLAADVALDGAGNPTITGSFSLYAIVDPTGGKVRLTTQGYGDAFTTQFTPNGVLRWARRAGGPTPDGPALPFPTRTAGIARAPDGAVLVVNSLGAGSHVGDTVGGVDIAGRGLTDVVVARYGSMLAGSAPVTSNLAVSATEGQPITFTVPASDPDGDSLAISLDAPGPGHGIVHHNGMAVTYLANGFSGTDSFGFTVHDGRGLRTSATVTVTVAPGSVAGPWAVPVRSINSGSLVRLTTTDPSGNVLAAGNNVGAVTIGDEPRAVTLTSTTQVNSIYLARFHADGRLDWFREGRGISVAALAEGPGGGGVITGYSSPGATLGSGPSATSIPAGSFVASFTSAGAIVYVSSLASAYVSSIEVDAAGVAHVIGRATTATTIAGTPIPVGSFLATISAAGAPLAAQALPATSSAVDIAVLADGRAFIVGSFTGTVTFGTGPGAVTLTAPSSNTYPFLLTLDASGAPIRARRDGVGTARSVTADAKGNAGWTIAFGDHGSRVQQVSPAGTTSWTSDISYGDFGEVTDAAFDRQGTLWVVGTFRQSASAPGFVVTAGVWDEVYLVHFSAAGAVLRAQHIGGPTREASGSIHVDDRGGVTIDGWYQGGGFSVTDKGMSFPLPAPYGFDGYVAQLGPGSGSINGVVTSGGTNVAGATVKLVDATLTVVAQQTTAADGSYTFNVKQGTYRVLARSGATQAWYVNGSTWWLATPIPVSSDETRDADIHLAGP
jgi:hypothetical protein